MPTYVVGRRAALELLHSEEGRKKIEKIFIAHGVQGHTVDELLHLLRTHKIAHSELDRGKFGELERTVAKDIDSQGVIILLQAVGYWEFEDLVDEPKEGETFVIVMLDGIEDPHNIGAIIRSAEALGARGILIPRRGPSMTPAVYKTSAGAALHLPIVKVHNLADTVERLREEFGFVCIGLAGEGEVNIGDLKLSGKICLVVGSEDNGLHQLVRKRCDQLAKIPMLGKTESLNASVAAAVAIYTVLNQ